MQIVSRTVIGSQQRREQSAALIMHADQIERDIVRAPADIKGYAVSVAVVAVDERIALGIETRHN